MKRNKTKYRICNDGAAGRWNFRWLEYKKGLSWHSIPSPREDNEWDLGESGLNAFSCVSQGNCEYFAEKWPYIEDYFEQEYKPRQKAIDDEKARNAVIYL